MRSKIIFLTNLVIFSLIFLSGIALADSEHRNEIIEGGKLVESKVSCGQLTDEQLEAVGEYLMEQMHPGESHEVMHKMMNMEEGTEYHKNFHINIAKTMYCGESGTMGMMPMMNMMNMTGRSGNSTMENMMNGGSWGFGAGWSWFGWIFMILFWILIIVGIVTLIKWLINQSKSETKERSALDILKQRYAKGEIDKKEFEEKKEDLS